jgi:hypothetical protein
LASTASETSGGKANSSTCSAVSRLTASPFFVVEFRRSILPHLSHKPALVGITFGIDKGELIPLTMYGQQEYVGRAINIACRLQAAVVDKGRSPAYTALVSNRVYSEYFAETKPHRVVKVCEIDVAKASVETRRRSIGTGSPRSEGGARRQYLLETAATIHRL